MDNSIEIQPSRRPTFEKLLDLCPALAVYGIVAAIITCIITIVYLAWEVSISNALDTSTTTQEGFNGTDLVHVDCAKCNALSKRGSLP